MTRKRLFAVSLMAGLVLWAAPGLRPSALQASDLESIAFAKEGPAVAVAVRIRGEFGNEAFTLKEPERLVIDVSPVDGISAPPQIEVAAGGVLRIRTGRFKAEVARIVFDLDGPGVMYRIDRTAGGLKITFWKEGASALR
ncbi:MAG TPA: AMIN domain-containing protein, partial [Acidobacteriota bacterium]|nr:AMIN domain-containing protein [Acidobacteriota bacterium]